jgi:primosomal protein N' (replication factor Y)
MIVDVALPIPVTKTFSYTVPDAWKPFVKEFLRLSVPFHNRVQTGVITYVRNGENPKLKEIHELIDFFPLVDETLISLSRWSAHYYITPIGLVLKYMLPKTLKIEPYITINAETVATIPLNGLTLKKAINHYGRDVLFLYWKEGLISLKNTITGKTFAPISHSDAVNTTGENVLFIGDVKGRIDYYMAAIEPALQQESNVLMLLPDHYAAGSYFKKILTQKFGDRVLWYGSGNTTKSRIEIFFKVRDNGGYLVLGNKSCLFLPLCRQTLIIVERHEEDEYRNEEGFKFNAPLLAAERARIGGIPIIMGSASPSMDIYDYAEKNKFNIIENKWLLDGPSQEKVITPDMGSSMRFLEELIPIIKEGAQKGERIAVFVPRKDYGSYLVCHSCKKPLLCPLCEGILGYEKEAGLLTCSLCNTSSPYEERCGRCGSNIIRFSRTGVSFLDEKIKHIFPDLDVVKITGDSLRKEIKRVRKTPAGQPLILVGTQSLSKLYDLHVDKLILLGWETLRKMGGYRADEKMVQILINLIDALTPENILFFMERKNIVNISNYLEAAIFYHEELQKRKDADFPPSCRAFLIEVQRKGKDGGAKTIQQIKDIFQEENIENHISGMLMEKKTQYIWRVLVRGDGEDLFHILSRIYDLPEVQIEPDPLYI